MDDFDDTPLSNEHLWKNFIFYTVVALFGMFMVGEAIEVFPLALDPGLTGVYALIYMMAMGVGEEQLFRGFFTDWLLTSLPNPYYALFCSAGIFCLYHLAVYGMVISSLAYVFFGGLILAWTSYRTLHLSPCQAGHSLNNFGAYVQQNGLPTAGIKYAITVILKVI
jgi:membrane protease YdiL (CAAX protease family)